MSPEQCRAARGWLNWSREQLAAKAQLSNSTLRDFELGRRVPIANNLAAIRRALEEAGMQFLFAEGDNEPWGVARQRAVHAANARQRKKSRSKGRSKAN
jgi:transcriptional regulator with XRE-family HTH domain